MSDKDNKRSYYSTLKLLLETKMEVQIIQYKEKIEELERHLEVLKNENYKLKDELLDIQIDDLEKALKLRQYEH